MENLILLAVGSFNPVTYGHLRMMEEAKNYVENQGKYINIKGLMSPVNDGYKKAGLINSSYRISMCKTALKDSKWITVDTWEASQLSKDGVPTVDVIKHIYTCVGTNIKVSLVCGADLLESFTNPKYWTNDEIDYILSQDIYVLTRDGINLEKIINDNEILNRYHDKIHIVRSSCTIGISSTVVRKLVSSSQSIEYLLPPPVIDYIHSNNLYSL